MSGGWYCALCGWTTDQPPVGLVNCGGCGQIGLRGYDNAKPVPIGCPEHRWWRGWDDGGVNDDLGEHQRRRHRSASLSGVGDRRDER